jgi:hypothetical protein
MQIKFRIPGGSGGMVQGMALGEIKLLLREFADEHGFFYTLHYVQYEFTVVPQTLRDLTVFMMYWNPSRPHWRQYTLVV